MIQNIFRRFKRKQIRSTYSRESLLFLRMTYNSFVDPSLQTIRRKALSGRSLNSVSPNNPTGARGTNCLVNSSELRSSFESMPMLPTSLPNLSIDISVCGVRANFGTVTVRRPFESNDLDTFFALRTKPGRYLLAFGAPCAVFCDTWSGSWGSTYGISECNNKADILIITRTFLWINL